MTDRGERLYGIGEMAAELGVSTRTLRYYEEVGLLKPSAYSKGGSRRYGAADRDRVLRIRELQAVMGFNLDEIREIVQADDRLDTLRTAYANTVTAKRRRDILVEAARLNARTQEKVLAKIALLEAFHAELEDQRARYRARADELGIDLPGQAEDPSAARATRRARRPT